MKKLLLIACLIGLLGCNPDYEVISTKVIRGRISSIDLHSYSTHAAYNLFIQTSKSTTEIEMPERESITNYKVGDSITLVVQQVKVK